MAILTAVLTASSAYAQMASAPAESQTDELNEVVVTAEKRSERLLSVAAPVTALQSADLQRQGANRLTDYAATVPGLNLISSEPGQTVVILRGITTGFGAAIAATTSTYIDDAPYGSATANALGSLATLDLDPSVLQRVEVLRGPQGTLYGASALGGLIKYVTIPPSLTRHSGRVELDGSSVDGGGQGGGLRATWNGPLISNQLGISISAFDRLDPGFIDDPHRNAHNVNSSRVSGGRVALLWQPTDRFSAEFAALAQDSNTGNTSDVDLNSDLTPVYGKYEQVRYGNENWDIANRHYSLRANYDFGWATLTAITSYQTEAGKWNIDESVKFGPLVSGIIGIPNLGLFDNVRLDHKKTTQEIRIASPDTGKLEWLAGLFFTHEQGVKPEAFGQPISKATDLPVPEAAQPGGLFTDILHDKYTEYAAYADLTYHLTDKFKVLAGLRATSDSETAVTPFSGLLNGPSTVAVGNSSSHPVTYLVAPSYNFNDRNMVYARYATGFRPGGPTGVSSTSVLQGAPESYGPDSLTNYEVGYKASFPRQRMTVDLSAFDIEWSRIQVLSEVNGFFVTGNGANARSTGGELAWTWNPIAGLSLSADLAYTHAYLTDDAAPIGGKSGDDLPDVPKFSANLGADYDFAISDRINGFVGASSRYMGSRAIDFVSGTPATYVRPVMPEYHTFDLHMGATRGDLTVEAYIRNIGNAYGFNRLVAETRDGYDPPLTAAVIQPRTFGLSLSAKF